VLVLEVMDDVDIRNLL